MGIFLPKATLDDDVADNERALARRIAGLVSEHGLPCLQTRERLDTGTLAAGNALAMVIQGLHDQCHQISRFAAGD